LQKIGYFCRRVAAKSFVKELLIQAGPLVDLVVIVESQTLLFTVLDEGKEDFILPELLGVGWRKLNAVGFRHADTLLPFGIPARAPASLHLAALSSVTALTRVGWTNFGGEIELPTRRSLRDSVFQRQ
jgi:hypothetical protein